MPSRPFPVQEKGQVSIASRSIAPGPVAGLPFVRRARRLMVAQLAPLLALILALVGPLGLGALATFSVSESWAQTSGNAAENEKSVPDPVVLALNRAREFRTKGEFNEALRLLDIALENNPRDLQLRFMKGLVYSDQSARDPSKSDQAIAVFESLTQDYPEVGEPHNNLAVLLAGKGELEKARFALERAILAQPNYALAYENLGDIYLRLAEKSYGEANLKNPSSKSAKAKLDQAKTWVKAVEK
jgi:tetratricopeptide (TPR) repeat protein